jgi:GTP-binding protein
MSLSLLAHAEYFRTVQHLRELTPDEGAEVAFAGRSNAGKSSAINALVNRRRLAFVSKTPGRTQAINFFALDRSHSRFLVDLPGYGYAAVSRDKRESWGTLISAYLRARACLRGLILVCDARRPPTALDLQLVAWFAVTGRPVHVLLTKADKLSRTQGARALEEAERAFSSGNAPQLSLQLYSSVTRDGVSTAQRVIAGWLQ